jgi:hypothetical protein
LSKGSPAAGGGAELARVGGRLGRGALAEDDEEDETTGIGDTAVATTAPLEGSAVATEADDGTSTGTAGATGGEVLAVLVSLAAFEDLLRTSTTTARTVPTNARPRSTARTAMTGLGAWERDRCCAGP